MPVDHNDDAPAESRQESEKQSDLREQGEGPSAPGERKSPLRSRTYVTRRNAVILGILIVAGFIGFVFLGLLAYRLGFVDRYVAEQIKDTLATYGIRAQIRDFHTSISPQTVELLDVELNDAQTGEHLGKISRLLATV